MEILLPTIMLLTIGFTVLFISRQLRISPMIGFIAAGMFLGPHGLNIIPDNKTTHLLAELGVVFLLFDIGLHLSIKSAWKIRREMFGLAPLQVLIGGLVIGYFTAHFFGATAELSILIGLTMALSSTAVVMQILNDNKLSESPIGNSAKAILIFQDLAAIFILIFIDTIGGDSSLAMTITQTLLKTALAFMAVIIIAKYIISPLMRWIIKFDDPEIFTMFTLLIVTVTAVSTANAGLSLTLGAFLAGMALGETPFRLLLQTELRPFRSLLMALFFVSVGMILNPTTIQQNIGSILGLTALLVSFKALTLSALLAAFKNPKHKIIQLTTLLSQGSEFAFILLGTSVVKAEIGSLITEELIAIVALSMLTTPILAWVGQRWSQKACNSLCDQASMDGSQNVKKNHKDKRAVFIVGMNDIGMTIARAMENANIPYIGVDHNKERFTQATATGYIVAYGQHEDLRFWNTLGIRRAKALIIASPRYEISKAISPIIKRLYPSLRRYVSINDMRDNERYSALGLTPHHHHGVPAGIEFACFLLQEFGVKQDKIDEWHNQEQAAYLDLQKKPAPKTNEKINLNKAA